MSKNFKVELDLDQSSTPPSKGMHVAKVMEAEVADNKAKDGKNLVLTFAIQTKGETGRRVTLWQSLKPQVAWRYSQVLAAFGFQGTTAVIQRKDFVGKLVKVQISHEDVNGETRASVDRVLPHITAETQARKSKAVEAEAEDTEDEDDDDEEEVVVSKPKPKAKPKRKPAPAPEPEPEEEEDDDEDEDEEDDPELQAPF